MIDHDARLSSGMVSVRAPDIHPLGLQVEEWMTACISSQQEWLHQAKEARLKQRPAS